MFRDPTFRLNCPSKNYVDSAPFNWLTCDLHEPDCLNNYCSSSDKPSLLNGFGCCHKSTFGQFHLPSGEKLCGVHMPECLNPNRPSVANCGGLLHPRSLGKFPSIDEGCGEFGFPTFSLRCCGQDCHCLPCLTEGCEQFEMELGLPITFSKAKVTIVDAYVSYLKRDVKAGCSR